MDQIVLQKDRQECAFNTCEESPAMTAAETKACADRAAYMRAWYADRRAKGMCYGCTKLVEGERHGLCPACYAKRRARERAEAKREHDRETRRRMWQAVDWSQPNAVIAQAMGVSVNAVTYQRHKAGQSYGRRGRPKKSVDASARPA